MSTLPSDADFRHEVAGPLLYKYLQTAPGATVDTRRRILRLIENMTMGRNAVGYLVESTHGAGSPQAQRVLIARLMDVESKKQMAKHLAGIEDDGGAGAAA
jgi:4-hydroxybutyryl-CoA dehydratase/vinylacetyl-CoA-Delta-isomerase